MASREPLNSEIPRKYQWISGKNSGFVSDFGLKSGISREMASRNPWIQKFLVNTNEFLEKILDLFLILGWNLGFPGKWLVGTLEFRNSS